MLLDFINLKSGAGALYNRLYEQIRTAVRRGMLQRGDRLPSIRETATQLGVSRTTVENAYLKLCIEGIAESAPQRGYYICGTERTIQSAVKAPEEKPMRYDFSGRQIDSAAADTELWKKTVREILRDTDELFSYGDPQGEAGLRRALAVYSYAARGVRTSADNIVVGAGIGPLLNILCGLTGRDKTVAFEGKSFAQAESIFTDYGIQTLALSGDRNGADPAALKKSGADILFLMPSTLSKISVTGLSARRGAFCDWVAEENHLIIEDDYNGELRYTARSVPAFQGKCPEKTVYIGSFSKLLLPSVRIAYMVLPDSLTEQFAARRRVYNQTCGKIEQLALKSYIESGALEKHLRRLRKLYYAKSREMLAAAAEIFPVADSILYESSLTVELDLHHNTDSNTLCAAAEQGGIRLIPSEKKGAVRFCFAGIAGEEIRPALKALKYVLCF